MASSLPPSRYLRPGSYIEMVGVPVMRVKSWTEDLDENIVLAAKQIYQQDLLLFSRILAPFAQCLVDGDPLDQNHPLAPWIQQHTTRFQMLRSLCREIMDEEPDCFTSELNFRVKWRGVRARLRSRYDPEGTSGNFDELLDQTEAVFLWRSGLTLKLSQPELSVRGLDLGAARAPAPRQDPRKYCIQPDLLVVDQGPEDPGVETRFSTVPAIPLDLDEEED